jgi:ribosomal-protein-alanine N-acetyltransferase
LPGIRIIRFQSRHLDCLMKIERASFGRYAYSRGLFHDLHASCGPFFFIARRGREFAGYAVGCLEKGRHAEIVSIAVGPAWRGEGIGAALMQHELEALRDAGARDAVLTVRTGNTAANRFYHRFRFRRVRLVPRYYEDGTDAWLMRRLL